VACHCRSLQDARRPVGDNVADPQHGQGRAARTAPTDGHVVWRARHQARPRTRFALSADASTATRDRRVSRCGSTTRTDLGAAITGCRPTFWRRGSRLCGIGTTTISMPLWRRTTSTALAHRRDVVGAPVRTRPHLTLSALDNVLARSITRACVQQWMRAAADPSAWRGAHRMTIVCRA